MADKDDVLRQIREHQAEFDDWLREEVRASLADLTPPIPMEEAFRRARAHINRTTKKAKHGS
jgi:hypothetical protein